MKIICVGRNYADHVVELKNETPSDPVIFLKPDTAILNAEQGFVIPDFSNEIHYEVELLIKIKKPGKYIDQKFAHKYYDKIGLGIDFTARDLQENLKTKGLPWEKAKGFDGSALIGDFIHKDEIENLQEIDFSLSRNNQVVQQGSSSQMIWNFDSLIAYISTFFTLKTGDIIFTGTPAGVGKIESGDQLSGKIFDREFFSVKVK